MKLGSTQGTNARTICSREIFTKKCRQQQNFDSDPKEAWHYNHVTFTPIAKNFMLYCRLIYMLSMLYVRLTLKVKLGIPESFKVGWYPHKLTGSSHLKFQIFLSTLLPLQYFSLSYISLQTDIVRRPRTLKKSSILKKTVFCSWNTYAQELTLYL